MTEPLLTIEELARYLGLAQATLREWTWQRRLPFLKLGRAVRYRRAEIEAWLGQHAVAPQGARPDLASVLAREGRHRRRGKRSEKSRPGAGDQTEVAAERARRPGEKGNELARACPPLPPEA